MKTPSFAALAVLLAAAGYPLDPARAPTQYVMTRFGAGTLGSNTVHALLQAGDGAIWIGTGAGLLRHDGTRFTAASDPALVGGVSSLTEGADGALYAGTTAGVVLRHANDAFTRLALPEPTGPVYALRAGASGVIWIGQHGRPVARWTPGGIVRHFVDDVTTVTPQAFVEDAAGRVWVGTNDGLHVLDGERFRRTDITTDAVRALCVGRDGTLWIGTRHGLLRHAGGQPRLYTTRDGLPADRIAALGVDRDGQLWIGTRAGLTRFSNGRFSTLTTREGLPDDDVRALLEDRDGNIWVGTGDGLARLSDGRFVTYGRLEGLEDSAVSAVALAREGGVWLGVASGDVVRLHPEGRLEAFRIPGGEGSEAVTALHEAKDGAVWVALANGRVFRLEGRKVTEHTPALDAHERQRVTTFFEDEGGLGVAIMRRGLAHLRDGRLVPFPPDVSALNYPHALHRDRAGALWIAGSQGLARVQGEDLTVFRVEQGLPHNRVRSISEDEDGSLWLATGGGLARLADGRFQSLGVAEGLPEDHLRVVLDDGQGHLWIAGLGSLFRLDKREALEVMGKRRPRVSPMVFDTSDGLRTTEALPSNAPAVRAPDGRLWFATTKGVVVVDPRVAAENRLAPAVAIESVTVDRQPGDTRLERTYGPGRGELTIDYGALWFVSPHRLRFRYRLVGLDDDWIEAGARRQAYYGALPAGAYRFEVMASDPDGRWSGATTALPFSLRPPFVRTPLFYALCAAALGLAAAAGHRLRVRQMQSRFDAVLAERTRIARELHDTVAQAVAGIGLQIGTALRGLDRRPETVRAGLTRAHAMARATLDEVRRSIWVLRAQTSGERDDLAATLERSLRQLTADSGVEPTFHRRGQPRRLPVAMERELLRVAHEAVTNALRHARASRLSVELDFAPEALVLRVQDDGRGFDFAAHLAASGREHFGLLGLVERARVLGGRLDVASAAESGTALVFRVPYTARAEAAESQPAPEGPET